MTKSCRFQLLFLGALCAPALPGSSQTLSPTTAPAQNWVSLAASSDGTRIAGAGSYGWIYISTNSGASWDPAITSTTTSEPERPWTGIASSADGQELAAVANFSPVFVSTNGGATWTQVGPVKVWAAVCMSKDGKTIASVDHQDGSIYICRDGGKTWSATGAPNQRWRSVACSADGSRLVAGTDFGTNYGEVPAIYLSQDFGVTWQRTSAPNQPWQALASSDDGMKLAAGAYGGLIYLSSDAGQTWKPAPVPSLRWGAIACSSDAVRLVASSWEGAIYFSNDSGRSWIRDDQLAAQWLPVACSADGNKVFVGAWGDSPGGIYSSILGPVLTIASSAAGTTVSWPNSAGDYVLQQSSDIASGKWQSVGTSPTIVNGQSQLTIAATSGARAFRLVKNPAITAPTSIASMPRLSP